MLVRKGSNLETVRYVIEPGDGTSYCFSLSYCEGHADVISGVGRTGEDYYTLTLHSPGSGSYEMRRYTLLHPASHVVGYMERHFEASRYTLMAILLMASALIDTGDKLPSILPHDLDLASRRVIEYSMREAE